MLISNKRIVTMGLPEERANHNLWSSVCKKILLDSLQLKKSMTPEQYGKCHLRDEIEDRLDRLLKTAVDIKHKELLTFSKRLIKYRESLLIFLYEHIVPPDNNGSERAVRNVKVKQKVSGQFRSQRGANNFVILRSVIDTLIKHSKTILPNLKLIAQLTPE